MNYVYYIYIKFIKRGLEQHRRKRHDFQNAGFSAPLHRIEQTIILYNLPFGGISGYQSSKKKWSKKVV